MKDKERLHQEDLLRIKNFRLMDDDFMTRVFDNDTEAVQEVLRPILGRSDLRVLQAKAQSIEATLIVRSARLDVLAIDSEGRQYDIEIQRADRDAGQKRARFNSAIMDTNMLRKGESWSELRESYVIFITERDVLANGLPIYHVERVILETNKMFDDGEHIIYVNGEYDNLDTELGRLMHDFRESDPNNMLNPVLASKSRFFKENEKGVSAMCKAIENMRLETWNEAIKSQIENMLKKGRTPEEIAEFCGYEIDFVKSVEAEMLELV